MLTLPMASLDLLRSIIVKKRSRFLWSHCLTLNAFSLIGSLRPFSMARRCTAVIRLSLTFVAVGRVSLSSHMQMDRKSSRELSRSALQTWTNAKEIKRWWSRTLGSKWSGLRRLLVAKSARLDVNSIATATLSVQITSLVRIINAATLA